MISDQYGRLWVNSCNPELTGTQGFYQFPGINQLIQMTLQAYLKGLLMGAYGMNADKRTALGQALRLIGPLHVPEFRKELISQL